jgi:hypothetical protein
MLRAAGDEAFCHGVYQQATIFSNLFHFHTLIEDLVHLPPWVDDTQPSSFVDQWIRTHRFYVVNRRQGINWKIGSSGPWGE